VTQNNAAAPPQAAQEGHPRRWFILGVLVFSLLVVVLDNTVLNVALKTIAQPKPKGLGASQSDLEWSINSYTLIFAGLLFTWGILADRLGRKRILMLGMALFGVTSLLCAYAGSPGELIAARAAMGFAGAAIMPSTLAVIANVFPRREQGKAIGIWAGSVGLAIAIGPVVGGALLDSFWWGSVFLINIPIIIIGLIAMTFMVPESRNPNPGKLDPAGVLLSMAGLVTFVYGVIHGGDTGEWGKPAVWGPLVIGVAILALFVVWERNSDHPALDVRLFANRPFSAAVVSVALSFFAMMGSLFFLAFYLQEVRGYTPLRAGLWMLPFAVAQVFFSPLSASLVRRFGARSVSFTGLLAIALAQGLYQFVDVSSSMWIYAVISGLQGTAMALVMPPATTTVMMSLPRERAGVGSSINNTVRQVGGALGVAVLGTVLTSAYRSRIEPVLTAAGVPSDVAHEASGSIEATGGFIAGQAQAHPAVTQLIGPSNDAFVHALHVTTLAGSGVGLLAAVLVFAWMPRRGKAAGPSAGAGAGTARAGSAVGEPQAAESVTA
jgi:EmrB/QacA subfamily drug resistance transporter